MGNESSLTDCPYTAAHFCHHGEDAAVRCQTGRVLFIKLIIIIIISDAGIICNDGDVRLVNGSQPHEGRVEVCFNETWGTICHYISLWSWNVSQADVICQQLGYSGAGNLLLPTVRCCA